MSPKDPSGHHYQQGASANKRCSRIQKCYYWSIMSVFRGFLGATLLFVAAGCGQVSDEAPASGSAGTTGDAGMSGDAGAAGSGDPGPRLVSWQVRADGAPPLDLGIFDTVENVHCRFVPDEAGVTRCLPVAREPLSDSGRFADAACSEHVWVAGPLVDPPAGAPPVALPLSGPPCEPARYVVGHLRVLPADPQEYYLTPTGDCVASVYEPSPGSQGVRYRATLVDRVASERYAATATISEGSLIEGRLRVKYFEHGTQSFASHLVDERWDKPCELTYASEGDPPCVVPTAEYGLYADAECKGPTVVASQCDDGAYVSIGLDSFALGEPYEGPLFSNVKICERAGTSDSVTHYYEVGEPLEGDAVAHPRWQSLGTGRVQARGLTNDGGKFVALPFDLQGALPAPFVDSQSGRECEPVWTPERKVRCAPLSVVYATGVGTFADADCKVPAFLCDTCFQSPCDCPELVIPTLRTDYGELHADSLNRAVRLDEGYWLTAGECQKGELGSLRAVGPGEEVSWDVYPELVEVNARPR